MAYQAPTGGTVGMNGEFYAGGQFLPNTELPKRHQPKPKFTGPKRVQLSRSEYADRRDGFAPIYPAIVGTYAEDRNGTLAKFTPYLDYLGNHNPSIVRMGATLGDLDTLIARFNAGERWIAV